MLARMLGNLEHKWPDRQLPPRKRGKVQVARLQTLDWSTATWFEHDHIPLPFSRGPKEMSMQGDETAVAPSL